MKRTALLLAVLPLLALAARDPERQEAARGTELFRHAEEDIRPRLEAMGFEAVPPGARYVRCYSEGTLNGTRFSWGESSGNGWLVEGPGGEPDHIVLVDGTRVEESEWRPASEARDRFFVRDAIRHAGPGGDGRDDGPSLLFALQLSARGDAFGAVCILDALDLAAAEASASNHLAAAKTNAVPRGRMGILRRPADPRIAPDAPGAVLVADRAGAVRAAVAALGRGTRALLPPAEPDPGGRGSHGCLGGDPALDRTAALAAVRDEFARAGVALEDGFAADGFVRPPDTDDRWARRRAFREAHPDATVSFLLTNAPPDLDDPVPVRLRFDLATPDGSFAVAYLDRSDWRRLLFEPEFRELVDLSELSTTERFDLPALAARYAGRLRTRADGPPLLVAVVFDPLSTDAYARLRGQVRAALATLAREAGDDTPDVPAPVPPAKPAEPDFWSAPPPGAEPRTETAEP